MKTAVFRMSCIYGTRQFGFEDQGWVAWFIIALLTSQPITIYGNGKQVRDLLYADDVINGYDKFFRSKIKHAVYNIGGGQDNTISLLEFIEFLEKKLKRKAKISFSDWRPSDQKVYITDITKVKKELKWNPAVSPEKGFEKLIQWVNANIRLWK
jgi:CDP-paratose 2-epimerase